MKLYQIVNESLPLAVFTGAYVGSGVLANDYHAKERELVYQKLIAKYPRPSLAYWDLWYIGRDYPKTRKVIKPIIDWIAGHSNSTEVNYLDQWESIVRNKLCGSHGVGVFIANTLLGPIAAIYRGINLHKTKKMTADEIANRQFRKL